MRLLLMTGLALTLAGCGGGDEGANRTAPVPTPTPMHGPMLGNVDLDKPIRTAGKGQGWSLQLAPGRILFTEAPDAPPIDFYPVSPKLDEGRAVFATRTPDAKPVTITLTREECMADRAELPLTIEARIGARTLRGCAGPSAPPARPAGEASPGNAAAAQ